MGDNIKNHIEDSFVSARGYCKIDNMLHSASGESTHLLHVIQSTSNINWFLEEIEKCCQQLLFQE